MLHSSFFGDGARPPARSYCFIAQYVCVWFAGLDSNFLFFGVTPNLLFAYKAFSYW